MKIAKAIVETTRSVTHVLSKRPITLALLLIAACAFSGCESPVPAAVDPPEYDQPAGHFLMYGEDVEEYGGSGTMHVYSLNDQSIRSYTEALDHVYTGYPFSHHENGSFLRTALDVGSLEQLLYYPNPLEEPIAFRSTFAGWDLEAETAHISQDGREIFVFLRRFTTGLPEIRIVAINLQDYSHREVFRTSQIGYIYPQPGTQQILVDQSRRAFTPAPQFILYNASGQVVREYNGFATSDGREPHDNQRWSRDGSRFSVLTSSGDQGWIDVATGTIRSFVRFQPSMWGFFLWGLNSRSFYITLNEFTGASLAYSVARYSEDSRRFDRISGVYDLDTRATALSTNGRYLALYQRPNSSTGEGEPRTLIYDLKTKQHIDTIPGLEAVSAFR